MASVPVKTWYAGRTRGQALAILALTALALLWGLAAALASPARSESSSAEGGLDLVLYRQIVERVHRGDSYYDAAGTELRANGYPTGSVFNWRTPVYAWLIGALPTPTWAQILFILGSLATLVLAYGFLEPVTGTWPALVGVTLSAGPFLWSVDGDAFFVQELWAGMLIALSVCAYAHGHWPAGLGLGLFALFFRELTLPYCLIAAFLARRHGRRREVSLWIAGLVLWALFWGGHALLVQQHQTPGDRLPPSWLQWGGAPFVLATCRMNVFLFNLPAWVSALYLPLALLGLAGWRGRVGPLVALTAGAYVAAYLAVGQPFNNYWGLLYAPLLPFGFVQAPAALRDLLAVARRPVASAHLVSLSA